MFRTLCLQYILEEALRDRFVCGLRSTQIQKRLLAEESLTWKTTVEMALAMAVRYVEDNTLPKETHDEHELFHIHQEKPEPSIMVPVKVNGEKFSMDLDTGASVSIMSEETWRRRFPNVALQESQIKLKTYIGEALEIIGRARVEVIYRDQIAMLPLQILKKPDNSIRVCGDY